MAETEAREVFAHGSLGSEEHEAESSWNKEVLFFGFLEHILWGLLNPEFSESLLQGFVGIAKTSCF